MSRDYILARIRVSLGIAGSGDPGRRAAARARLATPLDHLRPARIDKPKPDLVRLFQDNMRQQSADVMEAHGDGEVPALIAAYLQKHNVPQRIRAGSDPQLAALPWDRAPALELLSGAADGADEAALSMALAGVAETGTLVLDSGADNPTTLAFLPETHIVVIAEETIAGAFEDAIAILRAKFGRHEMPRSLNFVSAPSRTGDIGGKIVLGAHGPRRLGVIVIKTADRAAA